MCFLYMLRRNSFCLYYLMIMTNIICLALNLILFWECAMLNCMALPCMLFYCVALHHINAFCSAICKPLHVRIPDCHWFMPYSPMPSVEPPATWTNVGNQSVQWNSSLETAPRCLLGNSGPETNARFLIPPSNKDLLKPRLGKLLDCGASPPLSMIEQ